MPAVAEDPEITARSAPKKSNNLQAVAEQDKLRVQ